MQESLKDKTVRGVGWSFIDNIASSGITFLVGLILARLLTLRIWGYGHDSYIYSRIKFHY